MNARSEPDSPLSAALDASGFAVFSGGDSGAAHVMAHRCLDADRPELGYRQLGRWLEGRTGTGSDWLHLQFHMGIFELAVDRWYAAWHRFTREILPSATFTQNALTDAPGLLWRLALAAPRPILFPWSALRTTALASLAATEDRYVVVHNLLALAGAGDVKGLDTWLSARPSAAGDDADGVVTQTGIALREWTLGRFVQAAELLEEVAPKIATIGGSRAQNALFSDLARAAWRRGNLDRAAA